MQKINNKYRINVMIKTKISKAVMEKIYSNLNEYLKKASSKVSFSITRNPVNI